LPGNQPGTIVSTGSGGEINAGLSGNGIFYDGGPRLLVVNVGWGSLQGFTDLSSPVTVAQIHGPTPNEGGNNFIETAGVLFTLTTSTTAANGGTIAARITLTVAQEAELLAGRYYINIATVNNPGGEIRGFLQPGGKS
jgi:CHRD domain